MIKKYFTTTVRHLWRFRLFTALNILGLAVSISACWIIFRITGYEFSYDKDVPNKEHIYRLVTGFIWDEKESYNGGVSAPIYQAARAEIDGLDHVVPVMGKWLSSVEPSTASGKTVHYDDPANIAATDSSYFNLVPYRWLSGNKATALNAPEAVVLTESRAKTYFPGKKPHEIINQLITYYGFNDTLRKTVTGIVADLTAPTEFDTKEFFSLPRKSYELAAWTNTNGSDRLYLQLNKMARPAGIIAQVENIVTKKYKEFEQQSANNFKFKRWYELLPLAQSHFSTYIEEYNVRKASKPVLYGLAGIGLFLLLLACINYINMSVARIPQRAKEIGVRKTLGSSRSQLIGQFLMETVFTTFLAAIVSYFLSLFGFWILADIIPPGITAFGQLPELAGFILVLIIIVTLLAGLYPGWLITRVKTINVFRNSFVTKKGRQGFSLQKALIVFQFLIALVFITSALIVGKQLRFTLDSDMGFKKDAVVLVDIPWKYSSDKAYENKQFSLFNELKKETGIRSLSMGNSPMSNGYSSSQYEYSREGMDPVSRQVYKKWVDTAYLNFYGLTLLTGRNLRASDTTNEFVINETAVRAFGFASPQDAIGKMIGQQHEKFPIVGVIRDFHLQNFYKAIEPVALLSEKGNLNTFNIKLESRNPSQWQATLKVIEKKWYQFYPPESFSYKFYDEELAGMYEQERHFAKLINLATAIAIFISCLGLFGLATLTAFQRTKEIGIRKVLGASVTGIVQLLSKEYIRLVIISLLLSAPVAGWAMNKWLQDFAYRVPIKWWMFALAGCIAIITALITVSFQAIKAARANPVKSLRTE